LSLEAMAYTGKNGENKKGEGGLQNERKGLSNIEVGGVRRGTVRDKKHRKGEDTEERIIGVKEGPSGA